MNNLKVKKGDTVLVIAGNSNGKTGKVLAVSPSTNRVIVEGVNIITKAKKARTAQEKSQLVKMEAPINASNVMVVCPACNKATRVAHDMEGDKKFRKCKKCGASLDKVVAKKEVKKTASKETKTVKASASKPAKKVASKSITSATAEKKTTTKKSTKKSETK